MNSSELALLAERNPEFLTKLVKEHSRSLLKGAKSMGLADTEAKELVQRVWVTFLDVAHRFEGKSKISTFLFGIMYNKASEMRKESSRFVPTENEGFETLFKPDGHWRNAPLDPESFLISSERGDQLKECMDELPVKFRMAFYLREHQGEDTNVIAETLELTVNHLNVVFYRAKNLLRLCLEHKWKTL